MSDSAVAVISDAHLGEKNSWMERDRVQSAVVAAIAHRTSTRTLVLLGDTLDLNFGTLTTAIEGRLEGSGRRPGFRALLDAVCKGTAVDSVVYVPGNHDYMIWDWEAQQRNVLSQLARGNQLCGSLLTSGEFGDPFLAGLVPAGRPVSFTLAYPHYVAGIGEHKVVMTHGHHFERVQCGGVALADIARETDRERFLRKMAIAMAQYQTFAHMLAMRRHSRQDIHRWYWALTRPIDAISDLINAVRGMRGHLPSRGTFEAINLYLRFLAAETKASALVYGHSHRPGGWLPGKHPVSVPVYNCGSFVPPRSADASMLFLGPGEKGLGVELVSFSASGGESSVSLT